MPPMKTDLRAFEADYAWIEENRETLIQNYPNQWIGVRNGSVIASDPDLDNLIQNLPDPAHTAVEFIPTEQREVVLCLE